MFFKLLTFNRQLQEADRGCRGDRGLELGQVPEGSAAAGGGRGEDEVGGISHDQTRSWRERRIVFVGKKKER